MNYLKSSKEAHRMFKRHGQEVTLIKENARPYSLNTGKAKVIPTRYKTYAVIAPINAENIFQSTIEAGSKQATLSVYDTNLNLLIVPKEGDLIRDVNLKKYTIKEVQVFSPSGNPVFYACVIKGAGE